MLSLSLAALGLATISAYATPTTRTPGGLEIYLSTPATEVASATDLKVVAIVKNAGSDDLNILKSGTVLDIQNPIRPFIVSKDGKEVSFTGPTDVGLGPISEGEWTVIHAGEIVTVERDVSTLYDFSASGVGTFTFDPISTFQVKGPNQTLKTNIADVHPVSVSITGGVSKRFEKRQGIDCKDVDKYGLMVVAAFEVPLLADEAISYLQSDPNSEHFRTYFGNNDLKTVEDNFRKIASLQIPGTMHCSQSSQCSNTPAFIIDSDVYVCKAFFDQRFLTSLCSENIVNQSRTRAGTALSQVAQVIGVANRAPLSGCGAAEHLSKADKLRSADNYQCFASHAYVHNKCPVPGGG